jgi:hypothetical protein
LRSQLSSGYKVVNTPGPKTLRVRTGLTDVIENSKLGKPVVTVHPDPKITLSGNLGSATVATFVSQVSFEGEVLDSVSGERLSALVDHRIGNKREATATTSWASVRSAINQGVGRLRERFTTVTGR